MKFMNKLQIENGTLIYLSSSVRVYYRKNMISNLNAQSQCPVNNGKTIARTLNVYEMEKRNNFNVNHSRNVNSVSVMSKCRRNPLFACSLSTYSLIGVIVLLTIVEQANAIKCYTCSSVDDPGCGLTLDASNHTAVECADDAYVKAANGQAKVCRKLVQHAESRQVITRTCGWIDENTEKKDACIKRSGTFAVMVESCSCYSDACNAATANYSNWTKTIIIQILIYAGVLMMYNFKF